MPGIAGAVVVITGASSGIGRATALAFARESARLVLAARRTEVLDELARSCELAGGRAIAVTTDVTDPAAVAALADAAVQAFGRIDIWINNAGGAVVGKFWEAPLELHRRTIELNLMGTMHGCAAAIPIFLRQGSGTLINNISMGGWAPNPYAASYTASKFGLRGFTAALRQELQAHENIEVCGVFPAMIDTPGVEHGANYTGKRLGLGPFVYTAEDVAQTFLSVARRPRAETAVGWPSTAARLAFAYLPRTTERIVGGVMRRILESARPAPRTQGALMQPTPGGTAASGRWLASNGLPGASSVNKVALGGAAALGILVLAASVARRTAPRRRWR